VDVINIEYYCITFLDPFIVGGLKENPALTTVQVVL
jgi:hypothetical protein